MQTSALRGGFALVLAMSAVIGVLPLQGAQADEHGRGDRRQGHRHHADRRYEPRYPVYAPPPAYYPREESPGISIAFPFYIRH